MHKIHNINRGLKMEKDRIDTDCRTSQCPHEVTIIMRAMSVVAFVFITCKYTGTQYGL